MKAAVFYGRHEIRVEDVPVPEVGPEDVLIRVEACGVCGTDVHIYEGDKGAAECAPPTVLGHEFSGTVEKAGRSVAGFAPGDRVCVDPNRTCGKCDSCRAGLPHFCTDMVGTGTTANGGFAQYCSVHQKQVYRLADRVPFAEGAMAEPLSCCLHGIDLCEIVPGDSVVVIGGGLIGLLMVQLARLCGAGRVVLSEPVERKRELGRRLGADLCVDPLREDLGEALSRNGIGRAAAVIECVGSPKTIEQAIAAAGKRSVVMLFGLTKPEQEIRVRPFDLFQKEIVLKASYINPCTMPRAVELINTGRVDVRSMAQPVAPLERLDSFLSDPKLRENGKPILSPWMKA